MKNFRHQRAKLLYFILGLLISLFGAAPLRAQAFKVEGGSSSLLNVHGASMEVRTPNYTARFGVGFVQGPRVGFTFTAPYRGWLWELGDQAIPFTLPTDLFQRSYYFLGRGVGASRKTPRSRLLLYGGTSSRGYFSPFLKAAAAETGLGLMFYERQLSPAFHFYSYNLLSNRQTSLQSLEWTAREDLRFGLTGGLGNNQGYWSSSLNFAQEKVALLASYTHAGSSFRRVVVETPAIAESDKENIRLELVPRRSLSFFASRQNLLAPQTKDARPDRATVNGVGFGATAAEIQFHGSLYSATTRSGRSGALALGARRDFLRWLNVSLDFLRSDPARGSASHSVISTFREAISPRLSLSQILAHSNGQTTLAFGGNFLSNRLTLGMEYQTIYVPFEQANGSQFRQVLMVNFRMKLPRTIEFNGATHVTPLGQVRYTGYGSGFVYRGVGESGGSGGKFYDYVVQGRVLDDADEPIRGAALRICGEMVFSDSDGVVFLRRKKPAECSIEVVAEEFTLPGNYEVIDIPSLVRAAKEDSADWFEVRLKRVRIQPSEGTTENDSAQNAHKNETLVHSGAGAATLPLAPTRSFSDASALSFVAYELPVSSLGGTQRGEPPEVVRVPAGPRPAVRKSKPVKRAAKAAKRNKRGKRGSARAHSRDRRTAVASSARAKPASARKRGRVVRPKPVAAKRSKSRLRRAHKPVASRPRAASTSRGAAGGQ